MPRDMHGPVRTSHAVHVPAQIWGRLASMADDRGISVEDLLAAAISEVLIPVSVPERVVHLVRAGMPDAAIADRTGLLVQRVAEIRRRAHLPANRFYRGEGRINERKAS